MDLNEMLLILKSRSLTDLPELLNTMHPDHAHELASAAEYYAIWLIRAATYIDSRVYDMQSHEQAIKEQNNMATKVRRALGYSYPKQNITW